MKKFLPLTASIFIIGLLSAQNITPSSYNGKFCHPKPTPPAVTGNFIACAGNGIELNVTADENCTIHWIPECNAAQHTGTRYSIIMPIGGCNLRVVQENEAGCVSDTTLVSLEEFKLLPAPRFLTADVYDTLVIDSLYQPNVLYRWLVYPAAAAAIVGSNMASTGNFYFNYLRKSPDTYPVTLLLERMGCGGGKAISEIQVKVQNTTFPPDSLDVWKCTWRAAYDTAYLSKCHPKPVIRNVTIPDMICNGTPFQVQVEGENIDLYEWSFGDDSYARGEALWHTYRNEEMPLTYSVSVTGTNLTSGCSITFSHQISVMPDPLSNIWVNVGGIYGENYYGETSPRPFIAVNGFNSNYRYNWSPPYGETGKIPYIYHPNRTGYYQVTVTTEYGCIAQFQRSVYFKNVP